MFPEDARHAEMACLQLKIMYEADLNFYCNESPVGSPPYPRVPNPYVDDHVDLKHTTDEFTGFPNPVSLGKPTTDYLHARTPDSEDVKLKCGLCDLLLTDVEHAEAHAKYHTLHIIANPKCPACSLLFGTVSQYFAHDCKLRRALSVRDYNVCFQCNTDFNSASLRLTHERMFQKHKLYFFTTLENPKDPGHAFRVWARHIPADLVLTTPRILLQRVDELDPLRRTRTKISSATTDVIREPSQPSFSDNTPISVPPPNVGIFNVAASSNDSVVTDALELADSNSLNNRNFVRHSKSRRDISRHKRYHWAHNAKQENCGCKIEMAKTYTV